MKERKTRVEQGFAEKYINTFIFRSPVPIFVAQIRYIRQEASQIEGQQTGVPSRKAITQVTLKYRTAIRCNLGKLVASYNFITPHPVQSTE